MDGKIEGVSRGLAWAAERERLEWAVRVRWAVILGFGSLALSLHPLGLFPEIWAVLLAGGVGVVGNAVNHGCVRRGRGVVAATVAALVLDNVLIAWTCAWTGAFRSPMLLMFSVQVVATAMLVTAGAALSSAALAAVCLVALAFSSRDAPLLASSASASPALLEAIAWSACLTYGLLLLIFIGGFVSQRLRKREEELASQNRQLTLANEHLQQAEAQLVHGEKMRALGQLVAGVAHELNNPISFVSANIAPLREAFEGIIAALDACAPLVPAAEWQRHRGEIEPLVREVPILLDDCAEGARRVKQIVAELRTFSHQRGEDGDQRRRVDLNRRLEQTLHLLRHHFRGEVKLATDLRELPAIDGYPGEIDQVFLNLIVNAVEAVGNEGTIAVSSIYDTTAGFVRVHVDDDGPGIARENLERIFEPFFTTKPVGQGTGVGLSLSYAIVRRHGGTLTASSDGRGARFTVELPAPLSC